MPKISDFPSDASPEGADVIPFVDTSASRTEQVTLTNLAGSAAFTDQFAPLANAMGYVFFGSDEDTARPTGFAGVTWVGYTGTTPNNALSGDPVITSAAPDTTPPSAPTGLAATPGDTEVALDWDDNGEGDFASYEYHVDGGTAVSTGATSAVTVTGLTNDTEYDFQVRAIDDDDNASAWSTAVAATPVEPAAFNPLTQVTPLAAVWAEDPSWTPPSDGGNVPTASVPVATYGGTFSIVGTGNPIYRATFEGLNSKPAIEFDGNQKLEVDVTPDFNRIRKEIVVFKYTTATTGTTVLATGLGSANGFGIQTDQWFSSTGSSLFSGVTPDTNAHVARLYYKDTESTIDLDGVEIAAANAGYDDGTRFAIGGSGVAGAISRGMSGQVAFAAVYDSATSDAELDTLVSDLMTHYGIT